MTAEEKSRHMRAAHGVAMRSRVMRASADQRFSGNRQPEIFAQGRALVLGAEQATALQFGNQVIDDVVEAMRRRERQACEGMLASAMNP